MSREFAQLDSMKDVVGYEGYYKITKEGRIWSVRREHFLSLNQKKNGYVYIELNVGGKPMNFRVHRLLAIAYIPNPENKYGVNHINGIKNDNRIENLEWATVSENTKHAFDMGLISPTRKLYDFIDKNGRATTVGGLEEACNKSGFSKSTISSYNKSKKIIPKGSFKGCVLNIRLASMEMPDYSTLTLTTN